MLMQDLSLLAALNGSVQRGQVVEILASGEVRVELPEQVPVRVVCDVLRTTAMPSLRLAAGMDVLVLLPATDEGRGCILGAVGLYEAPTQGQAGVPAQVILEAKQGLTLQCGASSITLTAEGQMLLKGVDVVTRARRTHKIKAGSVHIN